MAEALICVNRALRGDMPSCAGRGSKVIAQKLEQVLDERNVPLKVEMIQCFGFCSRGPNIRLVGGPFRHNVKLEEVEEIADWLIAQLEDQEKK